MSEVRTISLLPLEPGEFAVRKTAFQDLIRTRLNELEGLTFPESKNSGSDWSDPILSVLFDSTLREACIEHGYRVGGILGGTVRLLKSSRGSIHNTSWDFAPQKESVFNFLVCASIPNQLGVMTLRFHGDLSTSAEDTLSLRIDTRPWVNNGNHKHVAELLSFFAEQGGRAAGSLQEARAQ